MDKKSVYSDAVAPTLVKMYFRSQVSYSAAFFLDRFSQVIVYAASFAAIWLFLLRFGNLAGWHWPQMALLLSTHLLVYSIGGAFSWMQMRTLESLVRTGQLDTVMILPYPTWGYLIFSGFNIMGFSGHLAVAVPVLIYALVYIEPAPSLLSWLDFSLGVVGGSCIIGATLTTIGATALFARRSGYIYPMFFGVWELCKYPMAIFPAAIQGILLVIPLGFAAYVPVAGILGKPVPFLGQTGGTMSFAVGILAVAGTAMFWRWSIRRYEGAGG